MKNLKTLLAVAIFALFSNAVVAQTQPVDKNNLAIGGYDVVSYFTVNKATKGTKQKWQIFYGLRFFPKNR